MNITTLNYRRNYTHIVLSFDTVEALLRTLEVVPRQRQAKFVLRLNNSSNSLFIKFEQSTLVLNVMLVSMSVAKELARRCEFKKVLCKSGKSASLNHILSECTSIQEVTIAMSFHDLDLLLNFNKLNFRNISYRRRNQNLYRKCLYRFDQLIDLNLAFDSIERKQVALIMKTVKFIDSLRIFSFNNEQRHIEDLFYFKGKIKPEIVFELPNIFELYHFDLKGVLLDVVYPSLLPGRQRSQLFISTLGNGNIFESMGKLSSNTYIVEDIFMMSEIRVFPQ